MQRAFALAVAATLACVPAFAQESAPATRAEVIASERADKVAELWPERQSGLANRVDGLVERGLKEGLASGKGANGFQLVLGGMRAGQGLSGGFGYRRSDLLREQLGFRVTARATTQGGYMLDTDAEFRRASTDKTRLRWYSRYEYSPAVDYFGTGNDSLESARTSYQFDDLSTDLDASFAPLRTLHFGATAGYFHAHTAPSDEEGIPPITEAFPPAAIPGFGDNTQYTRIGLFGYYDSRDSETGPRRGGLLGARYREYWDVDRELFAFRQAEFEAQKYFSYFNRSRVLAIRGAVVLSFPKEDNSVPMYLQPTLGGSDDLRGFEAYRFRDYHALKLGLEHRWHAFSMLDMALFLDAGKVVPLKRQLDTSSLHYSGGLGFRVRLRDAIITRVDFAASSEGFRMVWTFSDAFLPKY